MLRFFIWPCQACCLQQQSTALNTCSAVRGTPWHTHTQWLHQRAVFFQFHEILLAIPPSSSSARSPDSQLQHSIKIRGLLPQSSLLASYLPDRCNSLTKHQLPHLLPPSCLYQEQRWTASTIPWGNGKNRSCSAFLHSYFHPYLCHFCFLPGQSDPVFYPRKNNHNSHQEHILMELRGKHDRGIFLQCVHPASCGLSCNLASFPSPWGCEITQASFSYFIQNFSFIFLWRPDLAMTHLYWDWM